MSEAQPPIADYALLADGFTAALVSRDGAVDWWCPPRFDAPSAFGALLDPGAGAATVEVHGGGAVAREYLDGTLVLATTLRAGDGEARLLDCLPLAGAAGGRALLRVLEGTRGELRARLRVRPRFAYGARTPTVSVATEGGWRLEAGDEVLLCTGDLRWRDDGDGEIVSEAAVRAGERVGVLLVFDPAAEPPADLGDLLRRTVADWRTWTSRMEPDGPGREAVRRSATVLKALIHTPTGALVAAPTTSLPESLDGREHRTWDYRYPWLRDAALATRCLTELGYHEEPRAFRRFLLDASGGELDGLQVFYGVGGEREVPERELPLRGYRDAGPVRVGNGAAAQLQLDLTGLLVEQTWRWVDLGEPPDDRHWGLVEQLVEAAAARWREPDRGVWEWRGEPRHFVLSKVMCWVALQRGLDIAQRTGRRVPERRWRTARDEIREAVLSEGYDAARGTFRQAFGRSDLDAAALRIPAYGFLPYDDPRVVRTTDLLARALDDHGLLRRYDADDGLDGREGAFLACTFWLAECLSGQGRHAEARAAYRRATDTANDLGLFAEEADAARGIALGNFPQAFTHLAHVEATLSLPAMGTEL